MKVLITGGAGFIGSHVAEHFFKNQYDVYIVDNLSTGYRKNIPFIDDNHFFNIDITDYKKINDMLMLHNFDIIVHLAAMVSVVETIKKPAESNSVNVDAVLNILNTCKQNKNLKKFVFASSAAVYGNEQTLPKSSESRIQPESPYAIQKYSGEQYVKVYNNLYDLPTTALRFFNVYGPKQDPKSQYSGVLSIIKNAYENDLIFNFYGDGSQTRDFIYVKDIVQAIDIVVNNIECNGGIYNVGTGIPTDLNTVFNTFGEIFNKTINTKYYDFRKGDVKHSYADISKLNRLGFKPQYDILRGLNEYIEYNKS